MSKYVLVHGAWEGSWSWEDVVPVLTQQGHDVALIDLPGSFGNKQDIGDVTFENYINSVMHEVNKSDGKVILAGHSIGGIIISTVAERAPEKIEKLIYVTAFLLREGENALGAMQSDEAGELLPKLIFAEDQSYAQVSEKTWRDVAFHDADEDSIKKALARLAVKQATAPFMENMTLSEENFGSVPKIYIKTSLDKILTPDLQGKMIENWPVEKVHELKSGHFPALSLPSKLAQAML